MNTVSPESLSRIDTLQPESCVNKKFRRLFRGAVILLAGPTCVGKTDVSLKLAEILNGEIISADSMQVYKGMDIGTAKVSLEDRHRVPHHLIDVRHVSNPFNVVDFYYESKQACRAILNRGKVPIVVGGAGFYFHVFISGPPSGPPSDRELRKDLEQEMLKVGCEEMYCRLKTVDPEYAAMITPNDRHKVVRAFEIIILTKLKVSDHHWHSVLNQDLDYNYRAWYLSLPKEELYRRIDTRCNVMMEIGFLSEVRDLLSKGIKNNYSAEKAIGYREWIDFLSGENSQDRYDDCLRRFKKSSKSYTKRQLTWFKKHVLFRTLDISLMNSETTAELIAADYYLNS